MYGSSAEPDPPAGEGTHGGLTGSRGIGGLLPSPGRGGTKGRNEIVKTTSDSDLYDAEARMCLVDALLSCGVDVYADEFECTEETKIHDTSGNAIVSYWPTVGDAIEARWHQREECEDMNGDITCDDGEAVPHAYYSHLDL